MPDTAIVKVEDALKAALEAYAPLAGQTVLVDQSIDVAVDETQMPAIVIFTTAYGVGNFEYNGQSQHNVTIEFEVISGQTVAGTISRKNQETIAHIVACLAADRTLGGRVQDIQEVDVASTEASGRDVAGASLQVSVIFFTPRDDWFTLVGHGGALF